MNIQDFIHLAFMGQIILISYYFPRLILKRTTSIFSQYPPTEYPKLYPESLAALHRKAVFFKHTNTFIFFLGITVVMVTKWLGSAELATWDNQSVIVFYFILQASPMVWASALGMGYAKKLRQMNQTSIRKATLLPRKFSQLVPTAYFIALVASQLFFVMVVFYFIQYPFSGFAGYTNLFGLLFMNIFFGAMLYYGIFIRKNDPVQSLDVQHKDMVRNTHILLITLIAAVIKLTLDLLLSGLGLRAYQDIMTCAYFILIIAYAVNNYRFNTVNFELYR